MSRTPASWRRSPAPTARCSTATGAIAWRVAGEHPVSEPVIWNVDAAAVIGALPVTDAQPIGFAAGGTRVVTHEHVAVSPTLLDTAVGTAPPVPTEPDSVAFWDVARRIRVAAHAHTDVPPTIDPTGERVTTIDTDREVTVWNAADGRPRTAFTGPPLQRAQAKVVPQFV